jgi:hypothetical protein
MEQEQNGTPKVVSMVDRNRADLEVTLSHIEATEAESRGAALLTARLALAKAEVLCKAVAVQVQQAEDIFGVAGRDIESLAAQMVRGSLEQTCRDLGALMQRAGKARKGE